MKTDEHQNSWHAWFEGKTFSTDWTTGNIKYWSKILGPRREAALNVLEIGSWEGRSAICFLEMLPRSNITCIDTFDGGPGDYSNEYRQQARSIEKHFDSNMQAYGDRVTKLKGSSPNLLDQLRTQGARFDFIYVDGSHMRDDALVDTLIAWQLLKKGGVMLWDDYQRNRGTDPASHPKQAIDLFLASHADEIQRLHKGYQIAVEKTALRNALQRWRNWRVAMPK